MNSKYWKYTDGTARWKYDSPFENWLSRRADESEWMKALYVGFYRLIDGAFYRGGLPFIDREIANFQQLGGTLPSPASASCVTWSIPCTASALCSTNTSVMSSI